VHGWRWLAGGGSLGNVPVCAKAAMAHSGKAATACRAFLKIFSRQNIFFPAVNLS
jgi:hypothetical protein